MPGVGVRAGARTLIEAGDGSTFPTVDHLAAYAGLAPATRSSGASICGEQPSRRGNKQLKRAFFLATFAALADPAPPPGLLRQEDRPRQAPHPGTDLLRIPASHSCLTLTSVAAHRAVPFVERVDYDRVITKDAWPHALTALLVHTRFIAHGGQSALTKDIGAPPDRGAALSVNDPRANSQRPEGLGTGVNARDRQDAVLLPSARQVVLPDPWGRIRPVLGKQSTAPGSVGKARRCLHRVPRSQAGMLADWHVREHPHGTHDGSTLLPM